MAPLHRGEGVWRGGVLIILFFQFSVAFLLFQRRMLLLLGQPLVILSLIWLDNRWEGRLNLLELLLLATAEIY